MIKNLDFSNDLFRQTIVDKDERQYLGHVTTVLLEDNKTIIAVYLLGHGRGKIVMKKSYDAGLTWSERIPLPKSWDTSLEVPTIYKVVDKNGVKRLIVFSGLYPIRMGVSEDDGNTWSELEAIGDFGGIAAMSTLIDLGQGKYMAFFHDDGRFINNDKIAHKYEVKRYTAENTEKVVCFYSNSKDNGKTFEDEQAEERNLYNKDLNWSEPETIYESYANEKTEIAHVYACLSEDGGLTWGAPSVVATHEDAFLCEPWAIYSPDKSQIAVLLRENTGKYNSFVMYSNDKGKTWTKPVELNKNLTGHRHTAKYLKDGRIFISFRVMVNQNPSEGHWYAWVGTYDDIVNGTDGEYKILLKQNQKGGDCAYPGVEILPDETIVATTYGHWTKDEPPYILSVRINPEDLNA